MDKESFRISKGMKAFYEQQNKINLQLKQVLEPLKQIKGLFPIGLNEHFKQLSAQLKPLRGFDEMTEVMKSIEPIRLELKSFYTDSFNGNLEKIRKGFERLPDTMKLALLTLADEGCYLDREFPLEDYNSLKEACDEDRKEEVQEFLIEYFNAELDRIEKDIKEKHPLRAAIVKSAFKAHKVGEYNLSIPVLLAQIDGICKEITNQGLFTKRGEPKRPQIATYIDELNTSALEAALLSPLAEVKPINAHENNLGVEFTGLNRHMIIHGQSITYGTRMNSFKAISLLNYVSFVLPSPEEMGDSES